MKRSLPLTLIRWLGAVALCTLTHCAAADNSAMRGAGGGLPSDSVFQLPIDLVDQDGHAFKLAGKRGRPLIVSMFYNSCQFVCPMLVDTMRHTEDGLTEEERANLSMLLVTFDPARDDIAVLKSVSEKRRLDPTRWTLARTDAAGVRKLAAILGIQYRRLPDGEYNHSTALILLDGDGRILGRSGKMGSVDPGFLKLTAQATHGK